MKHRSFIMSKFEEQTFPALERVVLETLAKSRPSHFESPAGKLCKFYSKAEFSKLQSTENKEFIVRDATLSCTYKELTHKCDAKKREINNMIHLYQLINKADDFLSSMLDYWYSYDSLKMLDGMVLCETNLAEYSLDVLCSGIEYSTGWKISRVLVSRGEYTHKIMQNTPHGLEEVYHQYIPWYRFYLIDPERFNLYFVVDRIYVKDEMFCMDIKSGVLV